jgi:hypothetical protein
MFDDLSNGTVLNERWKAFIQKSDKATAEALARQLQLCASAEESLKAVKRIAEALAKRPGHQRSDLSRLIIAEIITDLVLARGFLRETASLPYTPAPQEAAPKQEVSEYLDVAKVKELDPLPEKVPVDSERITLEALDLAAVDKVTADLLEIERRGKDARDVSSMAHLLKAMAYAGSFTGKEFSKERRDELDKLAKNTKQEHLVGQVGIRAARTQRKDGGLSPTNSLASTYWRTNFIQVANLFLKKLNKELDKNDKLVNSSRVLKKLRMVLRQDQIDKLKIRPLTENSRIHVLSGTASVKFDDPHASWDHLLRELGATPSAYQFYELLDWDKTAPAPDFKVDTWADLMVLITSRRFARLREMARGKSRLAPVCAMIEHLVLGLTGERGPKRFDALTANAFGTLNSLLDLVVANPDHPSAAMRAIDLMMDEIGIVLAVARYYRWHDYGETMKAILLERAPSIKDTVDQQIRLDSHLTTSGMDSLATALWIALSSRTSEDISRPTELIDYYETSLLLGKLKKGETATPHKDVLVAALNPSTPFQPPSADDLVQRVLKTLETRTGTTPFVLILDTTIEVKPATGKRFQLDIVLGGLQAAIADGKLEVYLCKSFQKYASLGTGKVAAGDLTMLSKKGNLKSAYGRAQALLHDLELDLAGNDEGQIVVHMLKHGHRDELALISSAAVNAKFVDEFCWPISRTDQTQGSSYVEGIPLLMRSVPQKDPEANPLVDKLFKEHLLIDWRDSFSFLRTSFVGDIVGVNGINGPFVRINTGHEPKAAMVEFFYAFGHLVTNTPPGSDKSAGPLFLEDLKVATVLDHLKALDLVPASDKTGIERYRKNIVASYYAFAAQHIQTKSEVTPLLVEFFATSTGCGTLDTRRYLAGQLFSQVKVLLSADRTLLAALCHAAVVLPASEFKPHAEFVKSNLDRIGDSEEAKRLRRLVEQY